MKSSLKATSIIEAMIVLLIIVSWITGVYTLLNSSQKLAITTWNRIEAIQIARDWLEVFTNIRDTNWILYSADYENCWNTLNYDPSCIGDTWSAHRIRGFNSVGWVNRLAHYIYKNSNNQFELWNHTMDIADLNFSDNSFRSNFSVYKDNGFYTQSWGTITEPLYTRYLNIQYIDTTGDSLNLSVDDDKMEIISVVEWSDPSSTVPKKVEMRAILTNWKAKK
jgi:hypothetical protein